MNYSRQGKHRRLWRLAVATQPPIADYLLKGHVSIRHPLQAPKERSLQWVFVMVMKISKIKFVVY
ncbi:hypothetical protein [uncultured Prevotella sp.]|uniref:hypothetical protein n=1 Tax=uncultured Prevotella sp. TaxID=159272 RepID=UPI0027E37D4E|nr:hypothetical protein [uncultured Prevotella sp.]